MKIKNPPLTKSSNGVSISDDLLEGSLDKLNYPVFCFKHLHKDYNIKQLVMSDKSFQKQLLKKIETISQLSWTDIQLSDRHGLGTEKIAKSSIKVSIPQSLTKDIKDFLSFYFNGTRGRIVGYKNKALFHIVYIDTTLEVYDH